MPPTVGKGAISVAFVGPSVRQSVRPSRTLRIIPECKGIACSNLEGRLSAVDATRTSFKVKRSKVRVGGGRRRTVSAEPGGHTACCKSASLTVAPLLSPRHRKARALRDAAAHLFVCSFVCLLKLGCATKGVTGFLPRESGPYLRGFTGSTPAQNYNEKNLICPPVSVFRISVQWSFNVDQSMQTFDSVN